MLLRALVVLMASVALLPADTLHVLFVGNSHTYVNDLPGLFRGLSASAGRPVVTDLSAPGGYALMEHTGNESTLAKINRGGWHFVVLQEQSQIPSIDYWRYNGMYPAARTLDSLIRLRGCSTAFYMTWGWKYGGQQTYRGYSSPPFEDYFEMQDSVTAAYTMIADELGALLSPVGNAWARARRLDSLVDLWQPDNCHATLTGTYLGACVFYAALFHADPTGLEFTGGLSAEDALFCQQVAWQTVSGITGPPVPCAQPLLRVWPNPARDHLNLEFILPRSVPAIISIHDPAGRCLKTIVRTSWVQSGHLVISVTDRRGRQLVPGVYFCRLKTDCGERTQKLLLVE